MSIGDKRTVWLIGAGFSQSLGGPLLADLFRPREWGEDELVFPPKQYPTLGWDLYLARRYFNAGKEDGYWRDAEDFLAFVDSAHRNNDGPRKGRLRLLVKRTRLEVSHGNGPPPGRQKDYPCARFLSSPVAVRRALAAECSAFLLDLDDKEECWQPYREWAKNLRPEWDTVISFNYDRVLENLATEDAPKLKVLLPIDCPSDGSPFTGDVVPVLKLHGSVDWRREKDGTVQRGDVKEILASEMEEPFIAAPGRSKQDAVKELGALWKQARWALERAGALVVLGYGFPVTDTKARIEIQSAFTSGSTGPDVRRIDVVLGPDTSKAEVRRVHALLEGFKGQRQLVLPPERVPFRDLSHIGALYVRPHHLWAQDFIFDYGQRTRDA